MNCGSGAVWLLLHLEPSTMKSRLKGTALWKKNTLEKRIVALQKEAQGAVESYESGQPSVKPLGDAIEGLFGADDKDSTPAVPSTAPFLKSTTNGMSEFKDSVKLPDFDGSDNN